MKRKIAMLVFLFSAVWVSSAFSKGEQMNENARNSMRSLKDGNTRYVAGKSLHPRQDAARIKEVAPKQSPIAIVISCSDSRVPPEIVFDQGIGDLFVVRTAGNVLDGIGIGSVEYAAEHLKVPLAIVMGHKRCGAVTAAAAGGEAQGHIKNIVNAIAPAVREAKKTCGASDLVEEATRANIKMVMDDLKNSSPILDNLVKEGHLSIVGAYYDLDSGRVEFL